MTTIHLNPPERIKIVLEKEPTYTWDVECMFFCSKYKRLLIFLFFLVMACIIGTVVALSSRKPTTTNDDPCSEYKSDDLAADVSLACLRLMWSNSGCKGDIPTGYTGWWTRSPKGGETVLCIPPNINERCGVGNFLAIKNNIWVCDLNYKGFKG